MAAQMRPALAEDRRRRQAAPPYHLTGAQSHCGRCRTTTSLFGVVFTPNPMTKENSQ
jgi:hypothetical protein